LDQRYLLPDAAERRSFEHLRGYLALVQEEMAYTTKRTTKADINSLYDDIKNKSKYEKLLESDDESDDLEAILGNTKSKCVEVDAGIEIEAKRIELLNLRKSPPILFHKHQQFISESRQDFESMLAGCDCSPIMKDLFNPRCKGALKAYFTQNSFHQWCVESDSALPFQVVEAIYSVSLQRDEAYPEMACSAYDTMTSLISQMVRPSVFLYIILKHSCDT
jgi:hypothetical protein